MKILYAGISSKSDQPLMRLFLWGGGKKKDIGRLLNIKIHILFYGDSA
jgi:hypothetical protein